MASKRSPLRCVFLVAEADSEVGFGHLSEMRALAKALEAFGLVGEIVAVGPTPVYRGWRLGRWVENVDAALAYVASKARSVTVWSIRRPLSKPTIERFKLLNSLKVWLTDQPQALPPVDFLVMPAYSEGPDVNRKVAGSVLLGPAYFPLDPEYSSPSLLPLPFDKRTHDVLLTLGGADRTQVTPRLISAVAGFRSTVVIGPGFLHRDEVKKAARLSGVQSVEAPETLLSLLRDHRLVISSGGNTLYEAAAMGTPAFVTWEDPHEEEQATAFAKAGTARVLGRGMTVESVKVREAIQTALASPSLLSKMAEAGRRLVDGRGALRIAEAILALEPCDVSAQLLV